MSTPRERQGKPKAGPKRADSVSWQACECGCGLFYFQLYDARGRAFAQAWFVHEDLLRAAASMVATAEDKPLNIHFRH
jgi:hypothetical protein